MSWREFLPVSLLASIAGAVAIGSAAAADIPATVLSVAPPPMSVWQAEIGARYWYSSGKSAIDLYGVNGPPLVSRLTYSGTTGHAAEAFGRLDHRPSGLFLKGYAGLGKLTNGQLNDEDFPPDTNPYSSTLSDQRGDLNYASVDAGYDFWRSGRVKLGAFVGYHYLYEQFNAMGCRQIAGNPDICVPPEPTSVKIITQDNRWHSLRLGLTGQAQLSERLRLTADAAWLPYTWLDGADTHWLRIGVPDGFTGPVPDTGRGWGYQFEAVLAYLVTNAFSIGVGGRYWHMQSEGYSHFEGRSVGGGGSPQPSNWFTNRYGVFLQASYRFGASARP